MKWELIVDNEWIFEGTYEQVERMASNYWEDPDLFCPDIRIMSENEFYGIEEDEEA